MTLHEQLLKRLNGLVVKRPSFVLGLWGEPGIGKTHTTKNLSSDFQGTFQSFHASSSAALVARALPQPKFLPIWAEHSLQKLQAGIDLEQGLVTRVMAEVLTQLAPFVLHLEDIHELTPEGLAWIVQLGTALLHSKGVALVVTSRNFPPAPFEAIKLESMNFLANQNLLEAQIGAKLPLAALLWIQSRAAGNPLFSLEFFRFLSRQGYVWSDSRQWYWRPPPTTTGVIPVTVEALIERVLSDALQNPELNRCLQARALLGHNPTESLLAYVAGVSVPALHEACLVLTRQGVLQGLEFTHPLFAEVSLNQMSATTKKNYARRAIEVLQDNPIAACEFLELAQLEPEMSKTLLLAAASSAKKVGAITQEARFLARATKYLIGFEQEKISLEAALLLRHQDVLEALRLAEPIIDSIPYGIQAILLVAELQAVQGRGAQAEQILERLPNQERQSEAWFARLLWIRALGHNETGALEILKNHPNALDYADAETLYRASRVLSLNAQIDQAQAIVDKAFETFDLDLETSIWLLKAKSHIAYMQADFPSMEAFEQQIFELSSQLGNLRLMDAALFNRALALDVLGRQNERVECLKAALDICLLLNDLTAYMIAQVMYANSLHQMAEYEPAEQMLLEALKQLERIDLTAHRLDALLHLVLLYQDWQPPQGKLLALKYAHLAFESAKALGDRYLCEGLTALATTFAWTGQPDCGLPLAIQALEKAKSTAMPESMAGAYDALGFVYWKLEQSDAALKAFLEAQEIARSYGHDAFVQRIGLMIDLLNQDLDSAALRLNWFETRKLTNAVLLTYRLFPTLAIQPQPQTKTKAKLEVLGQLQVTFENQVITIRGKKRFLLLALLLEARIAGRNEISRLELIDALYPNEDQSRAASNLKELVRSTRISINPSAILTTTNGYALGNMISDAEEFLQTNHIGLWRGAYLNGMIPQQGFESVQESLSLALLNIAKSDLNSNPKEATRASRILLEMNPYNLEVLQFSIKALRETENYKSLGRVYAEARERLADVGEHLPMRWQEFLESQNVNKPA